MGTSSKVVENNTNNPQCQFFVVRKKRLCRMSVKPGKQYCGEHEPQPQSSDLKDDTRIPCPNDPKHTCYARKLEKHLSICNARPQELPDYIVPNINAPEDTDECPRHPLTKIPTETILKVVEIINILFDKHIEGNLETLPEKPIHASVLKDFQEPGRTESSLRHLRQASRLLHLMEEEQLVQPNTSFVELGAGKGQLSYYVWSAWCRGGDSSVLLVDRAALRHKRDNKAAAEVKAEGEGRAGGVVRLRADLAHLSLSRLPVRNVVAYAKHLCGVATDYALRCVTGASEVVTGVVLATCCHHRCQYATFSTTALQVLGIAPEEFNVMVGLVSWATCGDGRSRTARPDRADGPATREPRGAGLGHQERAAVGRRAKALLDWGRVLYLREHGFDARLAYYVPTTVSLENVCIIAKRTIS